MSHSTYDKQWRQANLELQDVLELEDPKDAVLRPTDKESTFQQLAVLYVRYIQILRKLEEAYDQIVHPQKRRTIRKVLTGVIGRIIELKEAMVEVTASEYLYFDDILADLKLTPLDIEIPIPQYFLDENAKELKEREKTLDSLVAKRESTNEEEAEIEAEITFEEAIAIIQVNERARQGRLRAKFMREIRQQEERERKARNRVQPAMEPEEAAVIIQKHFKGFRTRKLTKAMTNEELVFVGMAVAEGTPKSKALLSAKATMTRRKAVRDQHELEYQQALVGVKQKLREVEGPDMKENMQDQIRQWFIETRDATGKFPDYPGETEGGSGRIFGRMPDSEKDKDGDGGEDGKKKKDDRAASAAGKKAPAKAPAKKGGDGKGKKGKTDEDAEQEAEMLKKLAQSKFVAPVREGVTEYSEMWSRRDEVSNFTQKHDVEIIKEEKRLEIEAEIRIQVDELMREELKNLKAAVDRDKAGPKTKKKGGKKGGKSSGKKKGSGKKASAKKGSAKKKKGKGSGKKGKKEKDLTSTRTIESLYEELVENSIIKKANKVRLADYVGDHTYLGTNLTRNKIEPNPSMADVRRLLTEVAILPLGTAEVRESVFHLKSMLLCGPKGCGKRMLAHAIATETGSNLFDLTPKNTAGRYTGKGGVSMMLHIVFKLARILQPSVILIDDAEMVTAKKVPKDDQTDPKRIFKEMGKYIKKMKPSDRILIIGVTSNPFDADIKKLISMYQKIVMVPRPDYASRLNIWPTLIEREGGKITEALDFHALAKITEGYTAGHLSLVVRDVLTDRRIQKLGERPLASSEFIPPLAKLDPIYKEEEEAFKTWFSKTPLGRKRAKSAATENEGDDDPKGKKGNAKGKKKK